MSPTDITNDLVFRRFCSRAARFSAVNLVLDAGEMPEVERDQPLGPQREPAVKS
jgi:hypothetical protein